MYGSAQQSPYLQVALPLIEDVKGGEGLGSLWRVFTKCQGSIQDGSRLENISWRCVPILLLPPSSRLGGREGGKGMGHRIGGLGAGEEEDDAAGRLGGPGQAGRHPPSFRPSPPHRPPSAYSRCVVWSRPALA